MSYLEDKWLEGYTLGKQDIIHKKSWAENAPAETDSDYLFDQDRAEVEIDVKEEDLYSDTNWIVSSKLIYDKFIRNNATNKSQSAVGTVGPDSYKKMANKMMTSNDVKASSLLEDIPFEQMNDEQRKKYAEFGLEFMGAFNYNLPMMGIRTSQLSDMEDDTKFRFLQMMKTYDDKEITWSGTGRFFKNMLTDPTTYIGLSTLGVGVIGRHGVKEMTKKGLIEAFKGSIKSPTALAAFEGGTYFTADDALRQSVKIQGDEQTGFDFGQSAISFGTGALFGGALAKGANYLADMVSPTERFLNKVYNNAEEAQVGLVSFLKEATEGPLIINDKATVTGATTVDPGIKTRESSRRKIGAKGYTDPNQVTDIVRTGVNTDRPEDADAIVKMLSETYEIVDEGWKAYPGGYFDRKVIVTTPEGKSAEVQIWSQEIGAVKEQLWDIYDKARVIEKDDSKKNDYQNMLKESETIATAALIAGADIWRPIYDQINLTVPGL